MILCSGAFDGLHAGHVRYLQAARRLASGDALAVAIAPDAYIRQAKHREPYWPQADRAQTVFALGCVDHVFVQDSTSVASVITETHPRLFVKGPDWQGRLPEDVQEACQASGTEIRFVNTVGRHVREARR